MHGTCHPYNRILMQAFVGPPTQTPEANNIRKCQLATAFILNSDNKCFGPLKADLRENYARGTNQWPHTLLDAYNLLVTQERNDAAARRTKTPKTAPGQPQTIPLATASALHLRQLTHTNSPWPKSSTNHVVAPRRCCQPAQSYLTANRQPALSGTPTS